jgi:hypothetical protein
MNEHESLVAAVKQADVVISAVGHHHGPQELHQGQLNIVAAIKQAGNVKRFVPSEYGMDVEQGLEAVVEPARSMLLVGKVRVREAVRAAGIPAPTPSSAATGPTASCCRGLETPKRHKLQIKHQQPPPPSSATTAREPFSWARRT